MVVRIERVLLELRVPGDVDLRDAINAGDCSQVRGYAYKLSHLVALRLTKISANDPPSTWWPGER